MPLQLSPWRTPLNKLIVNNLNQPMSKKSLGWGQPSRKQPPWSGKNVFSYNFVRSLASRVFSLPSRGWTGPARAQAPGLAEGEHGPAGRRPELSLAAGDRIGGSLVCKRSLLHEWTSLTFEMGWSGDFLSTADGTTTVQLQVHWLSSTVSMMEANKARLAVVVLAALQSWKDEENFYLMSNSVFELI